MPKAVKVRVELAVGGEQLGVERIGARIAALDIVDAEVVEHARERELVVQREVDAVRLRAVAQRGVEEIEAFAGHIVSPEIVVRQQRNGRHDRDNGDRDLVGPASETILACLFIGRALASFSESSR